MGTHRTSSPEETLERVRPFLRRMGITRVANITGLDRVGIPVVVVVRPNSRSLATSQGKGLTLSAARASGVMESLELYHAEHIQLPLKRSTYRELRRTHAVVELEELPRPVRSPFHEDLPLLWVEGYDLLQDERGWVPYEMVHTDFTHPTAEGSGCFVASSNGLASGNHLLEALSHGLSEVVERDATTLWSLAGKQARDETRIDLESIDDPQCRALLHRFEAAGIAVGVWDITSDIRIATFLCRISDQEVDALSHLDTVAFGCHPARSIALLRALTEAAQIRLTVISGSRDDVERSAYERDASSDALRQDRAWFASPRATRRFQDVPDHATETFQADLEHQMATLRAVGLRRAIAVDLTQAELGVPVVRVIVPGLDCASLAPGRIGLGKRAQAVFGRRT